ncbi:MAG: 3-keto-5-aminohexanoate cleavage protein [Paracoccaceae bacterium]
MRIMVSPTGSRLSKADHPALPVTVPEIIGATAECAKAGANALHLHVRDRAGRHSLDAGLYSEAMAELDRVLPGLPVQITTEAGGVYDTTAQLRLLHDLRPDWVSISLREAARSPSDAKAMYGFCRDQAIAVQHIVYDATDAGLLRDLQATGALREQESVILVIGRYDQTQTTDNSDLDRLLQELPPVGSWMVCAFGPMEHQVLIEAAKRGGDVRVGFENSIQDANGYPWADNAASVRALMSGLKATSDNGPKTEHRRTELCAET